ncbi:MAG: hypothetical protein Q9N34_09055 [Aquificota bacterium]|nr:hypothetical protein [Aquificota bacterium]
MDQIMVDAFTGKNQTLEEILRDATSLESAITEGEEERVNSAVSAVSQKLGDATL